MSSSLTLQKRLFTLLQTATDDDLIQLIHFLEAKAFDRHLNLKEDVKTDAFPIEQQQKSLHQTEHRPFTKTTAATIESEEAESNLVSSISQLVAESKQNVNSPLSSNQNVPHDNTVPLFPLDKLEMLLNQYHQQKLQWSKQSQQAQLDAFSEELNPSASSNCLKQHEFVPQQSFGNWLQKSLIQTISPPPHVSFTPALFDLCFTNLSPITEKVFVDTWEAVAELLLVEKFQHLLWVTGWLTENNVDKFSRFDRASVEGKTRAKTPMDNSTDIATETMFHSFINKATTTTAVDGVIPESSELQTSSEMSDNIETVKDIQSISTGHSINLYLRFSTRGFNTLAATTTSRASSVHSESSQTNSAAFEQHHQQSLKDLDDHCSVLHPLPSFLQHHGVSITFLSRNRIPPSPSLFSVRTMSVASPDSVISEEATWLRSPCSPHCPTAIPSPVSPGDTFQLPSDENGGFSADDLHNLNHSQPKADLVADVSIDLGILLDIGEYSSLSKRPADTATATVRDTHNTLLIPSSEWKPSWYLPETIEQSMPEWFVSPKSLSQVSTSSSQVNESAISLLSDPHLRMSTLESPTNPYREQQSSREHDSPDVPSLSLSAFEQSFESFYSDKPLLTVLLAEPDSEHRKRICQLLWKHRHAVRPVRSLSDIAHALSSNATSTATAGADSTKETSLHSPPSDKLSENPSIPSSSLQTTVLMLNPQILLPPVSSTPASQPRYFRGLGRCLQQLKRTRPELLLLLSAETEAVCSTEEGQKILQKLPAYSCVSMDSSEVQLGQVLQKLEHRMTERILLEAEVERMRTLLAGNHFPKLTRVRELGQGAFGTVWEVRDELTGGRMALKTLQSTSPETLLLEVEVMCGLRHPNIVHYFFAEVSEKPETLLRLRAEAAAAAAAVEEDQHVGSQSIRTTRVKSKGSVVQQLVDLDRVNSGNSQMRSRKQPSRSTDKWTDLDGSQKLKSDGLNNLEKRHKASSRGDSKPETRQPSSSRQEQQQRKLTQAILAQRLPSTPSQANKDTILQQSLLAMPEFFSLNTTTLNDTQKPSSSTKKLVHKTRSIGFVHVYMELVSGGSLQDVLDKRHGKPLRSLQTFLPSLNEILNGLAYLHAQSISHADIKPANIMFDRDGRAKIGDFGSARILQSQSSILRPSSPLQQHLRYDMTGTLAYMAPECLAADVEMAVGFDTAADIWSLGATVLHFITGKPPNVLYAQFQEQEETEAKKQLNLVQAKHRKDSSTSSQKNPVHSSRLHANSSSRSNRSSSTFDTVLGLVSYISGLHDNQRELPLERVLDEFPREVSQFVQACMAVDPSQRSSAEELRGFELLGESFQLGLNTCEENPSEAPVQVTDKDLAHIFRETSFSKGSFSKRQKPFHQQGPACYSHEVHPHQASAVTNVTSIMAPGHSTNLRSVTLPSTTGVPLVHIEPSQPFLMNSPDSVVPKDLSQIPFDQTEGFFGSTMGSILFAPLPGTTASSLLSTPEPLSLPQSKCSSLASFASDLSPIFTPSSERGTDVFDQKSSHLSQVKPSLEKPQRESEI